MRSSPTPSGNLQWNQVHSVFKPDQPIGSILDLVGRDDELASLLKELSLASAIPVVSGPPGIGKTSLLNVASSILVGYEDDLPPAVKASIPPEISRLVVWIKCDVEIDTFDDLASRLTRALRSAWVTPDTHRRTHTREFSVEFSLPFLKLKTVVTQPQVSGEAPSCIEDLQRFVAEYCASDREIIFMIDECEHLSFIEKLLGFVRLFEHERTKFIFGIRDGKEPELRRGPYGDYRWPVDIRLGPLGAIEVASVFDLARTRLGERGFELSFSDDAIDRVITMSAGQPWYLHMLGNQLLRTKFDTMLNGNVDQARLVTSHDLDLAETQLIETRLRGIWHEVYSEKVGKSDQRAELLHVLAWFPGTLIPESYLRLIRVRRLKKLSKHLSYLSSGPFPVLTSVTDPVRGVEFADHPFRVFCRHGDVGEVGLRELAHQLVDSWTESQQTM